MNVIAKLFWVALTVVFTFCFVVLFEFGPTDYSEHARFEFEQVKALFAQKPVPAKRDIELPK